MIIHRSPFIFCLFAAQSFCYTGQEGLSLSLILFALVSIYGNLQTKWGGASQASGDWCAELSRRALFLSYTALLSSSVPYEYPHTPPFPLGGIDALPNSGRPRSLYSVRLLRILGLTIYLKSELPRVGLSNGQQHVIYRVCPATPLLWQRSRECVDLPP